MKWIAWFFIPLAIFSHEIGGKVEHSESEWKEILGNERFQVMRLKKTERSYSGSYVRHEREGAYLCAACSLPLFSSEQKYNAGNGWPSFRGPIDVYHVYFLEDHRLSFKRYEVLCRRCDSHLGHVFHDGPPPKYLRYCINSLSLQFSPKK